MPKATKWTGSPEQIDEIVARFREGESVKSIRSSLSCRSELVSDALRDRGYRVGRGQEKISFNDKVRLMARYNEGAKMSELATEFGMSAQAVSALLRREGVKSEKWENWTPERYERLRGLVAEGLSQNEIADLLGISQGGLNARFRQIGIPPLPPRSGENHGGWKGGRVINAGYVFVRPTAEDLQFALPNCSGYVAEHRLIMARSLGRMLLPSETVHHKNGVRDDNRLENLQLRQGKHGSGVVMVCADCGSHNIVATALL